MPHVVLTGQRGSEGVAVAGPYPSGLAALIAADLEQEMEREAGSDLVFRVAALYPAMTVTPQPDPPGSIMAWEVAALDLQPRRGIARAMHSSSVGHAVRRSARRGRSRGRVSRVLAPGAATHG
jgi:hypothetical protein